MQKPFNACFLQERETDTPGHKQPDDEPPVPPDQIPPAPINDPPAPNEKAPIDEGPKGPKMIV